MKDIPYFFYDPQSGLVIAERLSSGQPEEEAMAKKAKAKKPIFSLNVKRAKPVAKDERVHAVLCEIRDLLREQREPQADVARDIKKLEQARKF